jgi:hypothetical protein
MCRILQGKDIFAGVGKEKSLNGLSQQNIKNEKMDILYRHSTKEIYFKDRMNGLMIKIGDVQESNGTAQ